MCINPHIAAKPSSHVTLKEPSKAALQPEMESNPDAQALHDNIDYHLSKDPVNKGQPTELLWSLMSKEVIYTSHTTNTSLYSPLYSERLYDYLDLSEINTLRVLKGDCSDRLEEVQSSLKISTHFEKTSDVSTTYMGEFFPTGRDFKFENQIFVSGSCTSQGPLMDKTPKRVFFDTGASKSYMSMSFYMANTSLYTLPKVSTMSKGIIVGNGQLIPVICSIQDHVFEIFTIVADIHESIDRTEIDGDISTQTGSFKFLNRSIPLYSCGMIIRITP